MSNPPPGLLRERFSWSVTKVCHRRGILRRGPCLPRPGWLPPDPSGRPWSLRLLKTWLRSPLRRVSIVAPRTLTSLSRAGAETTSSPTEPVLLCLMRYRLRSMRTACYDSRVDWIGMPNSKLPRSSHRRPNRDRIATHFDLGNCDPRQSPSPAIAILGNCDPRVIATPSIFAPDGHPAQTLGVRKLVSRN